MLRDILFALPGAAIASAVVEWLDPSVSFVVLCVFGVLGGLLSLWTLREKDDGPLG